LEEPSWKQGGFFIWMNGHTSAAFVLRMTGHAASAMISKTFDTAAAQDWLQLASGAKLSVPARYHTLM